MTKTRESKDTLGEALGVGNTVLNDPSTLDVFPPARSDRCRKRETLGKNERKEKNEGTKIEKGKKRDGERQKR